MIYMECPQCGFDAVVKQYKFDAYCPDCDGIRGARVEMQRREARSCDLPVGRDDREYELIAKIAYVQTDGPGIIGGRAVVVYRLRKNGAVLVKPFGEFNFDEARDAPPSNDNEQLVNRYNLLAETANRNFKAALRERDEARAMVMSMRGDSSIGW